MHELLLFLYPCITKNYLKRKWQLEKVPPIKIESHYFKKLRFI
jgi:hypothetical protein